MAEHRLSGHPQPGWRRALALALPLTLVHLWLADIAVQDRLGAGAGAAGPTRIVVAFVRELAQREPAPTVAPLRPLRRAASPGLAPVAPLPAASAPLPVPEPPRLAALEPVAEPLPAATEPAAVVEAPAASAPKVADAASAPTPAAGFEWPPSTRLTYTLTGYYRGAVEGQAQVEWLRQGDRYQVHLDVSVGPPFAPLMSRRMSSDGRITDQGLRPLRYDEDTRVVLRAPRPLAILFDEREIRLPAGQVVPLPAGVQDAASQFVQMTWMFTMQPALLEPGRSLTLPLALPRRVEAWTYDILASGPLDTPAGVVQAVHVKPRREAKPGSDLTAELWVAPSLQYLPVRILIRQDAETFVDLVIERLPQQALPAGAPATTR